MNTLSLPANYVVIDSEEMEYIDGGVYFSNATLMNVCKVAFLSAGFAPVATTLVALGVWKVYSLLVAASASIGFRLGALSGPIGIAIGILGTGAVASIGYTLADALIQKKGVDIGVKKTYFGMPYGLDIQVK